MTKRVKAQTRRCKHRATKRKCLTSRNSRNRDLPRKGIYQPRYAGHANNPYRPATLPPPPPPHRFPPPHSAPLHLTPPPLYPTLLPSTSLRLTPPRLTPPHSTSHHLILLHPSPSHLFLPHHYSILLYHTTFSTHQHYPPLLPPPSFTRSNSSYSLRNSFL